MHSIIFILLFILSIATVEAKSNHIDERHVQKKSATMIKKQGAQGAVRKVGQKILPPPSESGPIVVPTHIAGKIPLPKQFEYQTIVDETDEYSYSVKRLSANKVSIYIDFPLFTKPPRVTASVESDIPDVSDRILNDLKHPTLKVDAPYKAVNRVRIVLESDYIVNVSLPIIGSFKAEDVCIHFIAEEKNL